MSNRTAPKKVITAHVKSKEEMEDSKIVSVSTAMLGHIGPEATAKLIESAINDTEKFLRSYASISA